jgi:hypothetical protein
MTVYDWDNGRTIRLRIGERLTAKLTGEWLIQDNAVGYLMLSGQSREGERQVFQWQTIGTGETHLRLQSRNGTYTLRILVY